MGLISSAIVNAWGYNDDDMDEVVALRQENKKLEKEISDLKKQVKELKAKLNAKKV